MSKDRFTPDLLASWKAHIELIKSNQPMCDPHESARDAQARADRARRDYAFFVQEYFPHYASRKPPRFHIDFANAALANPHLKATVEWYRGAAKSVVADVLLPLWLLVQQPCQLQCMVLVGVNEKAATRLLNDAKAELEVNEHFCSDFKVGKKTGDWADKEFTTNTGSMFVALGLGQSVRGLRNAQHRPDYVVIDDIDDLQLSRNAERLGQYVQWIERSVLGVFTAKRSRLFVVNNRIAKDQVLVRMKTRKPHWPNFHVPALLKDGRPAWPEEHNADYWADKRLDVGEAAFMTEYMLEPVVEGTRFRQEWIGWDSPEKATIQRIVVYIDPSWRNTRTSDHKAVKAWAKLPDNRKHLLRCFVRRADADEMVGWCYDLFEELKSFPVVPEFYIEGIFMQDDHLQEFHRAARERGYHLPLVADYRRKPQKESRIESMIPVYKRGLVTYDESQKTQPDMMLAIDHLLGWDIESSLPDDSPDADESAWHIIDHMASFASGGAGMISMGRSTRSTNSKYRH